MGDLNSRHQEASLTLLCTRVVNESIEGCRLIPSLRPSYTAVERNKKGIDEQKRRRGNPEESGAMEGSVSSEIKI